MNPHVHQKVKSSHLQRNAYLYIRQSSLRQVLEHTESTKRQYALRERAAAMGWPSEQIVVIDSDQGQSGASAIGREGFQHLVAEVGLGRAGIVLGLEVSRLARSSTDWHRLLEICALTDTLILDEEGVYDPSHFNDRLLLGLKGTMSEAELHMLKARMRGGVLNKARRGELKMLLPVGFVHGPEGQVILDPDQQVQRAVTLLFESYRRTGSAYATVNVFHQQGVLFPRPVPCGPRRGELAWGPLIHNRVLQILHNPRYAGAFSFGRTHTRKIVGGRRVERLPREQWDTLIHDAHPGYISWEEYEENNRRLRENAQIYGKDRRRGAPRQGPALLQGLAVCGACGDRMTVRYHYRGKRACPDYVCQRHDLLNAKPKCQIVPGAGVDDAIGQLLVESVTPMALEVALRVQQELVARAQEGDQLRRQQIERARYEAELARRRYMRVDPDNRLVADSLEADWNQKLRALNEANEEYERRIQDDQLGLSSERRAEILALATDFPRLWKDEKTSDRDRKRMVRLMLEDVTLFKNDRLVVAVRFKGGATTTLNLPGPMNAWELKKTSPAIIHDIDRLLDTNTDVEIAEILNQRGVLTGTGQAFHRDIVKGLRTAYNLKDRFSRLRARGLLTEEELASRLKICTATVRDWRRRGRLSAYAFNDRNEYLYEAPSGEMPRKWTRKRSSRSNEGKLVRSDEGGAV